MNRSSTPSDLLAALRERTRFRTLVRVADCPSTQALAAVEAGPDPEVYWADHQTAGRGRQGRSWDDEPGADLAVTFRLPGLRLPDPLLLAAATPVALCQALEAELERPVGLKWPNDLLLSGRKLCGILIDVPVPDTYLVGVGINVNRTRFPAELEHEATSLALATGRLTDRGGLLLRIAEYLDRSLAALESSATGQLEELFRSRIGLVDRHVVLVSGGEEHRGVVTNLDFSTIELDGPRPFALGAVQAIRRAER